MPLGVKLNGEISLLHMNAPSQDNSNLLYLQRINHRDSLLVQFIYTSLQKTLQVHKVIFLYMFEALFHKFNWSLITIHCNKKTNDKVVLNLLYKVFISPM